MLSWKQVVLVLTPPLVLATTYVVFQRPVVWLGLKAGYFCGFVFYWVVWCLLRSWLVLGTGEMARLFRDVPSRLGRPAWLGAVFLATPLALGFGYAFPRTIQEADVGIVVLSALIALVNGSLEELLWRGT